MHLNGKFLIGVFVVLTPATAMGQVIGDANKGKAYASEVCSQCHAVDPGRQQSPVAKAPPFQEIANTSGMTSIALAAWFQSSHPTMPNIQMSDAEMRNAIQYILSLKEK